MTAQADRAASNNVRFVNFTVFSKSNRFNAAGGQSVAMRQKVALYQRRTPYTAIQRTRIKYRFGSIVAKPRQTRMNTGE
jgi:hypothetical protein